MHTYATIFILALPFLVMGYFHLLFRGQNPADLLPKTDHVGFNSADLSQRGILDCGRAIMSEIDIAGPRSCLFSQVDAEDISPVTERASAPFDSDKLNQAINPATGLLMVSGDSVGVDVGGNPFGMDNHDHFGLMDHGSGIN
ncbi:MAG: hypothetical protein PHT60_16260 [Acidiphilium sp.]|nr:hypothetical protein [Acidiphilium sp.]MDD4937318.1 hypothetical protein [Acidiphilium sp.]